MKHLLRKSGSEKQFVDGAFRRFFMPALLSNLGLALGNMVDSLVVGNKLGQTGLSAIALGIPVYMFYNILSYGFSIGGSIHYAKLLGRGDQTAANRLFSNVYSFLLSIYIITVALGLMFLPQLLWCLGVTTEHAELYTTAARYVRAQLICIPLLFSQGPLYFFVHSDGAPKRAATALVTSCIVDIILNYVFVIRLNMGAEGSVWSTAIGALFCLVICGWHIVKKRGMLRFCGFMLKASELLISIKTGFASAVQYLYQFIVILIMNTLLLKTGGVAAVAAFDIIYALSSLPIAVADASAMTIQPMVSTYIAERDEAAVHRTLKLAIIYGFVFSAIATVGLAIGSDVFCRFFGLRDEALSIGTSALLIYCISILPSVWNQVAVSYRQTTKRENSALLIQTLRLLVIFIPALYVLSMINLTAMWWVFPISELFTLIFVLFSFKSETPVHNNIIGKYTDQVKTVDCLSSIIETLQNTCETWGYSSQQSYYATLVVEELCVAILEDAAKYSRDSILINLTVVASAGGFSLHIRDNSLEFNPFSDESNANALGMTIVRSKAKDFFYRRYQGFNTLVVEL